MTLSTDRNETRPESDDKKSISAHRAFVYGASAPGLGEIYAGSRMRGFLTAALFLFFGGWFTWTMVEIVGSVVGQVFDGLNGIAPFARPDLPFVSGGISFFGIYFIWLWAMISAVDVAVEQRHKNAEPPQASVAWAVVVSWFCPGAGQVYTADRRLGYILFAGYLMGILLIVPAYLQMFQGLSDLAKNEQLSANNPYAIIDFVHDLITRVNYSFGKLFQKSVQYYAIAGTMAALRQDILKTDTRWSKPSIGYGAALIGIGWLCPGAGQLLQGRNKIGWYFLAGYIGSKVLIGLLLGHDFITIQRADTLAWISIFVQWGAIIETLFRMMKGNVMRET